MSLSPERLDAVHAIVDQIFAPKSATGADADATASDAGPGPTPPVSDPPATPPEGATLPRPAPAGCETVNVPDALKAAPRWVCWRYELRPGKGGKPDKWSKAPHRADNGDPAASNNPATWAAFDAATAAYGRGGFDGIGFVLGGGWAGIDLDDVRDTGTGELLPWAEALVRSAGTYAEVSPSTTGVKVFGRGDWAGGWTRKQHPGGGEVEIYTRQFFTVTGRRLLGSPAEPADLAPVLDRLAREFAPPGPPRPDPAPNAGPPDVHSDADDAQLLEAMFRAKNGAKARRLWDGDDSGHGGDTSRADLALCGHLAFWCGFPPDPARVDRLFRQSKRMRGKWDEGRSDSTYGADTVAKAFEGRTEYFTPPPPRAPRAPRPSRGGAATGSGGGLGDGEGGGSTAADALAGLGIAGADLFHDAGMTAYAAIGRRTLAVKSRAYRQYLTLTYRRETGKVPPGDALASALNAIEAAAVFDGPERPVFARVAEHGGAVYYHLADADDTVIKVDAGGWRECPEPPVRFIKAAGALASPAPERGGDIAELKRFVNCPDADAFALLLGFMVNCFRLDGPFPLLVLTGEQGSAKSTTARVVKSAVDPARAPVRAEPKESRDLMIAAKGSWVMAFDNISSVPVWLSDALCRLSTGGGFATRTLYENEEETVFDSKRPVVLNGITEFVTRADLLERSISLHHPPIAPAARRPEKVLWAEFEAARPRLLGALLDRVAAGVRALPSVDTSNLPRMADACAFAAACELGAGEPPRFLEAFRANQKDSHDATLADSPVAAPVLALMDGRDSWEGTPTALFGEAAARVPDPKPKDWPRRANGFMNELGRVAPSLRRVHGLDVSRDGRSQDKARTRLVTITRRAPGSHGGASSAPPAPPPPETPRPPTAPREPATPAAPTGRNAAAGSGVTADAEAGTRPEGAADDPRTMADGLTPPGSSAGTPLNLGVFGGADDADGADDGSPHLKGSDAATQPQGGADAPTVTAHLPASAEPARPARPTYTVVTDPAGLADVVAAVQASASVGLDTETSGLDPRADRLCLLSLATDAGVFLVYCADGLDPSPLWPALAAAAEVVGHNLAFDLQFLARLGFVPGKLCDTMLVSQVLEAGNRAARHGLKDATARHLGIEVDKAEQLADWAGPLTPAMLAYAAEDARLPLKLRDAMRPKLAAAKLTGTADLENAALAAVTWASAAGVGFDRTAWAGLAAGAASEAARLRADLDAMAPGDADLFGHGGRNWDSPDQVREAFATVGVTLESTDDDALAALEHPLAAVLRDHRGAAKLASTYGTAWLANAAPDGRVYCRWRQLGTMSGRMSAAEPNLQQLPRDIRYRRCFVALPGRVLVKADYSQIELRLAAKIAGDKAMRDAYARGDDLHALTAKMVLGKAEVTKADRQTAKAVNFGLLFGAGARTLAAYAKSSYGVTMTVAEAAKYRGAFFKAYPGLKRWHDRAGAKRDAAEDTRTVGGRRRAGVTSFTEKLNSPVQGSAADGLKDALRLLWERRGECPSAVPVLFVHDEIVVEVDEAAADAAKAWLTRCMVDGMARHCSPVPVEVEATVAKTWGG